MCDVALDPYTSHGHDGIIVNKKIDNDDLTKYELGESWTFLKDLNELPSSYY